MIGPQKQQEKSAAKKSSSYNETMAKKRRKIIVTSALPYSNGDIHLGHLVEYLQTDFWVRHQKMQKNECLYFCADDSHGTPIMISAQKKGIDPQKLIQQNRLQHLQDFADFGVEFTHYGSTDGAENQQLVSMFFEKMKKNKHLSTREIQQSFCEKESMFLPDRFVRGDCPFCDASDQYGDCCEVCGHTYAPKDLKNPRCTNCGDTPILKKSEHIFFELNHFKDFLRQWIKEHTAPESVNKLLEWFDRDLKAWDISRDEPYFGFEIPGHPKKYFYVWLDAPIGYIATCHEWAKKKQKTYLDFWQNDAYEIHHFIGKDIVYFHCLFWPAMLRSAELNTPTQIHIHGFLTFNGKKLSKSRGNIINAKLFAKSVNPEYLRYYFASRLSNDANDINFNLDDFLLCINSELIAKIVNLLSRSMQMIHKKDEGKLSFMSQEGIEKWKKWQQKREEICSLFEHREFSKVIKIIRDIAEKSNQYLDQKAPWKSWKENPQQARSTLCDVVNFARIIAIYLAPVLPQMSQKIAGFFHESPYFFDDVEKKIENITLNPYVYLARVIEKKELEMLLQK